jgi:adenosylcobinamide-phosphate synthase
LLVAVVVDAIFGEPPSAVHPVVWMGRLLQVLEKYAPTAKLKQLAFGTMVAFASPGLWALFGRFVERSTPWPVQALALKCTFAGSALLQAGTRVECELFRDDLESARRALRSLVSRPTAQLDPSLVSAAAIESLAENFVDSWLAPLLSYALFGLPGAYAYRAVNTADAMWGYRTPRYLFLGRGAARLDDVLNWIPARLGALVLIGVGLNRSHAAQTWWRDANNTSSPNAGQSMSAMAGQLGVRLEKVGEYTLNGQGRNPDPRDIRAARHLVLRAMGVALAAILLVRNRLR